MSGLGDQLAAQFGGRLSGGLRGAMAELRGRYGTVTAAARAAGVDRRTWQRWESGAIRTPKAGTVDRIEQAVRGARAESAGGNGVRVKFRYDGRDRDLTFGGGGHGLTTGTVESMRRAYAQGDKEAMARAFIDGVEDPWYHDSFDEAYEAGDDIEAGEGSDSVGLFAGR